MDLILTLDYELFGNGSGNVFKHIIEPTNKLLELCNKYDIKITIFFEILEYLKIKEVWQSGNSMGYEKDPANAIENQIKKAYKQGHDIQLHLHPQWLNGKYENGWIVNNSLWRLPEVTNQNSGYSINELLKIGKSTIENLLKPINSKYTCNILRAGGYNILPSEQVVKAMINNDFIADSSVYPGGFINSDLSKYDYRSIKRNIPYWWIEDYDVLKQSATKTNILEFPIFSLPIRKFHKLDRQRIKVKLQNKDYAKQQLKQKSKNKNIINKMKYYFEKESTTWDYLLFNNKKMNKFLKKVQAINDRSTYKTHPFVMIGHSKEAYYLESLKKFIIRYKNLNYFSMRELIEHIKGNPL